MFTGLVEEMGTVVAAGPQGDGYVLEIAGDVVLEDATFGASINVNGVCLSITAFSRDRFSVGLAPETLRRTNLGDLKPGDPVNLERACLPTTRLGGHYVQGHVDGTGTLTERTEEGDALLIRIETTPAIMRYVVPKGYVTVDGTSLTVIEAGDDHFTLTLISHTQALVTLARKQAGDRVNLEVDIMAKYAEKWMSEGVRR